MVTVTDATFEESVMRSSLPVAVFFKSAGCPFCARMAPTIEEVAAEFSGRLKTVVLDVSDSMRTALRYGVMSVPQVLFFKAGEKVAEIRGWASKTDVVKKIESVLQ